MAARLERSKALEQRFDPPRRVVGAARIGAEAKIVDDAELGKDLPALGDQDQTLARDAIAGELIDAPPEETHFAGHRLQLRTACWPMALC